MKHTLTILATLLSYTLLAPAAAVTRGPYLQSAGADRITICWRTDVPTTSDVVFGLLENPQSPPVSIPGTRVDHAVTLTGLQASTRYFYRVKGTPASGTPVDLGGSQFWFKTSPVAGTPSPTRIWVLGDSGYQTNYADIAFANYMNVTAAAGKTTDLFLMLGDNAYPNGTDSQYQGALFNRYPGLLRNAPLWSAIGNHDDTTVPAVPPAPYFSIFNFPMAGECGGVASGTEQYYSFDRGNIHFICIDSNTYATVADSPGGTYGMVDWLRDDLMACTADWIIAYMHEGPYSKGSHDSDTELNLQLTRNHIVPLLESFGTDLVLCGHSHSYERSRLIDGHYGASSTWNSSTMQKWPGNGSEIGGVAPGGNFTTTPGMAGGAYHKAAATGRAGSVYAVVGASSSAQSWQGGSSALVNPTPHPAHIVSLTTIGSLVIEVQGQRLNAQYLDQSGFVRDDFTILKGATYTLHRAMPTTEGNSPGIAFPVTRTGSVAFAEQVPVAVDLISGGGVPPAQGLADFAAGQSSALVKFFPSAGGATTRFDARLLTTTRPLVTGGAPRSVYQIAGTPQTGQFAVTPAATWYASRFGTEPSGPGVWNSDADGDGLPMLLEYALGGEPDRNDSALMPQGKVEGNSFIYRYNRPHGRSDLTYQILGSGNLSTWPLPGPSDVSDGPVTALGEPRKVTLPVGAPLKFVRLKVELQP